MGDPRKSGAGSTEVQPGQDLRPQSSSEPNPDVVAPEFDTLIKGIEGAFPKDGAKSSKKG